MVRKIGILALQGNYNQHKKMLDQLSINNIYEGTKNYPKQVEHPEWKLQLMTTFKEFKGTKFYWVEPQHSPVDDDTLENLKYITYVNIRRNICL